MKIVTIHQPDFIPWIGFFRRWKKSDLYIILDDVQFLRRGWHHRDKIRTKQGEQWLSLPISKKGKYEQKISDVFLDQSSNWRIKHLKTIELNYKKAAGFNQYFPIIQSIYQQQHTRLIDLSLDFLKMGAMHFDIQTPIEFSHRFSINTHSTQRLVDLTKKVNGTHYLTGLGSKDYLEESLFDKEQITVIWDEYSPEPYPQIHGDFIPGMSLIDLVMNRVSLDV